ncbi:MAG: AmmeMemoRadiSam system protein B, partial [Chloroflexota bacterium]|nr:AmmeMemoRadiSam system protein B [Chloroflexota bacterium]
LIRPSPIAGTWYPGSPDELQETVDGFLAHAEYFPTDDELIALISPHAGYPYSGQTAAYAYRQLEKRQYDTVVLMGPSHYADFGPYAVSSKKFYATPLGAIELDQEFIDALSEKIPLTRVAQDREHSLEIQLPFLQRVLGDFKFVPIMMSLPFYVVGADALAPCQQLADALAEPAKTRRVLFVASSDLSHLPDYSAVKKNDARTEELVAAYDVPGLVRYMWHAHACRACGDAPIVTALLAAKALGADRARVLHRTNSGDVTGERERAEYVVGYMAVGVYKSQAKSETGQ